MNIDIIKSENKYGIYAVPKNSSWRLAAKTILDGEVYEPDTIRYIIDNCADESIIHAGTYFGDFLPALSKFCKKTVFSFEPNLENYKCARMTCDLNSCKNITLKHNALGDCKKRVKLKVKNKNKSLGGLSKIVEAADIDTEEVFQTTIDDVVPDSCPVSVLHLDLEGYELKAIGGAIKIIKKFKPTIIIEDNHDDYNELKNLGYKYEKKLNNNLVWK